MHIQYERSKRWLYNMPFHPEKSNLENNVLVFFTSALIENYFEIKPWGVVVLYCLLTYLVTANNIVYCVYVNVLTR